MTLNELQEAVECAIEKAEELGQSPDAILVSIQIDRVSVSGSYLDSVSATEVDLEYDGDACVSGCVLLGVTK